MLDNPVENKSYCIYLHTHARKRKHLEREREKDVFTKTPVKTKPLIINFTNLKYSPELNKNRIKWV